MNMSFDRIAHCTPRRLVLCLALALAVTAPLNAAPDDRAMAPNNREQQNLYWEGHEQLKAGQWEEAVKRFATLEENLRRSEPASADAAMYWRAYALAKAKRVGEARGTLERLRREFPDSRWASEVARLQETLGAGSPAGGKDDAALVDAAIEGLMSAPPERALPLLKRVMEGKYSSRSKQRALFVLSQLDHPEASALLLATTRSSDRKLAREAITMLGIGGDVASLEALYRDSNDRDTRKAVLSAYLVAGHQPGLLAIARDPSDPKLRREAIHLLGASGGKAALGELLAKETDADVQEWAIDALGVAGDRGALVSFVRDATKPLPLRRKAINSLAITGDSASLAALYRELDQPTLRSASLDGMLVSGGSKELIALYREAGNDDDKRRILRMLSIMGDDTALEAIEAAIKQGEQQ